MKAIKQYNIHVYMIYMQIEERRAIYSIPLPHTTVAPAATIIAT